MKQLGTILPSKAGLAKSDAHFDNLKIKAVQYGKTKLSHLQHRFVDGEDRFYNGKDEYSIVTEGLKVLTFIKKEDGYWYSKK